MKGCRTAVQYHNTFTVLHTSIHPYLAEYGVRSIYSTVQPCTHLASRKKSANEMRVSCRKPEAPGH